MTNDKHCVVFLYVGLLHKLHVSLDRTKKSLEGLVVVRSILPISDIFYSLYSGHKWEKKLILKVKNSEEIQSKGK